MATVTPVAFVGILVLSSSSAEFKFAFALLNDHEILELRKKADGRLPALLHAILGPFGSFVRLFAQVECLVQE